MFKSAALRASGVLFLLAALLPPCVFAAEAGAERRPIVIGGTLSATGRYEKMSRMAVKGYRLWEDETNRKGGILGRPVRLEFTDDDSSASVAVKRYKALMAGRKADFILSPYSSELVLAIADDAEKYGYPLLAIAAAEKIWETPRRYTMGIYSSADRYFIGFLELCAIRKVTRIALTAFPDPFSRSACDGIRKWAGRFGLTVVHFGELERTDDAALAAEAAAIASAKPQAVVSSGYLDDSIRMRKAVDTAGLKDIVFAGSVGPAIGEFQQRLGPLAEGAFGASQWEPDERIAYPGSKAFIESFRAVYREEPSYHAASAYASLQLLSEAIRTTGSTDRRKVRDYLAGGSRRSIMGPFLLKNGRQVGHKSLIIQWQKGKKEIVWPEKMQTASPAFP